jgi:hypothetical protein
MPLNTLLLIKPSLTPREKLELQEVFMYQLNPELLLFLELEVLTTLDLKLLESSDYLKLDKSTTPPSLNLIKLLFI